MKTNELQSLLGLLDNSLEVEDGKAVVKDATCLRANIHRLAEVSVLDTGPRQGLARYITRLAALAAGVYPASINDLYMARGRGEVPPGFTVPAVNLRALSFDAARAVFCAAKPIDAGAFIFEIARSEMGYTDPVTGNDDTFHHSTNMSRSSFWMYTRTSVGLPKPQDNAASAQ